MVIYPMDSAMHPLNNGVWSIGLESNKMLKYQSGQSQPIRVEKKNAELPFLVLAICQGEDEVLMLEPSAS